MLDANMRNFTIFLHGDADQARIAADPETQRWWTFTDPCQESLAPAGSPGPQALRPGRRARPDLAAVGLIKRRSAS